MARSADRPATSWIRKLVLSLVVGAGTFAGLEGGSYLFGDFKTSSTILRSQYWAIATRDDPLLFWSLQPNVVREDGTPWTNSDGLRGPEIGPKPAGEYRILSLGESTTYAPGMDYEKCYSAVLERKLTPWFEERGETVRVLNAGVSGYSLVQGYEYLRNRGLALEPDAVLLYFGYNDFLPVSFKAERMEGTAADEGLTDRALFAARQRSGGPSRIDRLVAKSNLLRGLQRWASTRTLETDDSRPRVPAGDRETLLARTLALCVAEGIDLVIAVPWYREFDEHEELLRDFAREQDVPIVDLPAVLEERLRKPRPEYFRDKVHPLAPGHVMMAQAIAEVFLRRVLADD